MKKKKKNKEIKKGVYICRYCGKEIASFNCSCLESKKLDIWKAKRRNNKKK